MNGAQRQTARPPWLGAPLARGRLGCKAGLGEFGRKRREAAEIRSRYPAGMTYRITGLDPAPFAPLFHLDDAALAERNIVRMTADSTPGFPCRVTLDDAEPGETLLLLNHVSHDGDNPYRATHAIFVSGAGQAASYADAIPPALDRRTLSIRAFDAKGMMTDAALAAPGEADAVIRRLLADAAVDHLDAHNAVRGCFAARVDRA